MQSAALWKLFEKTGNIGVYMLYKKTLEQNETQITKEGQSANADSGFGDSDKRN